MHKNNLMTLYLQYCIIWSFIMTISTMTISSTEAIRYEYTFYSLTSFVSLSVSHILYLEATTDRCSSQGKHSLT